VKARDSFESRYEERLLRPKAKCWEQKAALISAKCAEIRQIELFVVRLESECRNGKQQPLFKGDLKIIGGIIMRFSDLQKKEVIEVKKGSFMGFVQDATIDMKNGKIDVLQIGGAERTLFLEPKMKDLKQIKYDDVLTIGKDIVLVGKRTDK